MTNNNSSEGISPPEAFQHQRQHMTDNNFTTSHLGLMLPANDLITHTSIALDLARK
jgi:hypothetical protein